MIIKTEFKQKLFANYIIWTQSNSSFGGENQNIFSEDLRLSGNTAPNKKK